MAENFPFICKLTEHLLYAGHYSRRCGTGSLHSSGGSGECHTTNKKQMKEQDNPRVVACEENKTVMSNENERRRGLRREALSGQMTRLE